MDTAPSNPRLAFPDALAAAVSETWRNLIAGDYVAPPLPNKVQLRAILEVAYLASMEADEGRPTTFALCCTRDEDGAKIVETPGSECWEIQPERAFNIQELRRLAQVGNVESAAIWVRFQTNESKPLRIAGLINLGRSWSVARSAMGYHYDPLPHALLIRVTGPGRLAVYQGEYCVGTLSVGLLQMAGARMAWRDLAGINGLLLEGHEDLRKIIPSPSHEPAREWNEFEWIAYLNVILAILNAIQAAHHGGALILKSAHKSLADPATLKIKYRLGHGADALKQRFIAFMAARHRQGDLTWKESQKIAAGEPSNEVKLGYLQVREAYQAVAKACAFVAGFSSTDGAIVLNADLTVEGFGAEIVLDKLRPAQAYEEDGGYFDFRSLH